MLSRNSFLKFVSHYPARQLTSEHHQALVAERSKALQLSCRGLAGCGFESRWRHIFILNFSLPPRSEQVNGAVANEIKHVHSPEVIVVLDHRYDLSYKALYISTCSIALRLKTGGCDTSEHSYYEYLLYFKFISNLWFERN